MELCPRRWGWHHEGAVAAVARLVSFPSVRVASAAQAVPSRRTSCEKTSMRSVNCFTAPAAISRAWTAAFPRARHQKAWKALGMTGESSFVRGVPWRRAVSRRSSRAPCSRSRSCVSLLPCASIASCELTANAMVAWSGCARRTARAVSGMPCLTRTSRCRPWPCRSMFLAAIMTPWPTSLEFAFARISFTRKATFCSRASSLAMASSSLSLTIAKIIFSMAAACTKLRDIALKIRLMPSAFTTRGQMISGAEAPNTASTVHIICTSRFSGQS
mmetsp:Transcript_1655/g.5122  ORF Transcript_1655/g.5122 Transcript_1655/m.5122 type:complete len:273 (+) Transcript_1655:89-907(+)